MHFDMPKWKVALNPGTLSCWVLICAGCAAEAPATGDNSGKLVPLPPVVAPPPPMLPPTLIFGPNADGVLQPMLPDAGGSLIFSGLGPMFEELISAPLHVFSGFFGDEAERMRRTLQREDYQVSDEVAPADTNGRFVCMGGFVPASSSRFIAQSELFSTKAVQSILIYAIAPNRTAAMALIDNECHAVSHHLSESYLIACPPTHYFPGDNASMFCRRARPVSVWFGAIMQWSEPHWSDDGIPPAPASAAFQLYP